ncbi:MAG: HutD family protein [Pseudomonadota bacterium]
MSWRTIHLADVPATPWRNGGGLTRELAAWPSEGAWRWRMSVAEVTSSGPFSRFEGITRWFAVLKGAGVALTVRTPSDSDDAGDCEHRLTVTDPALCFDGGATTHCALLGGPTQDFNLMVQGNCLPARMVRVQGELTVLAGATKTIAVYAVDSGASVRFNAEDIILPAGTLVWRTLAKAATVHIHGTHVLWMELST